MTATLFAQFYERGSLDAVTARGDVFEAVSAEGGEVINGIGYGKVTVPLYDNFNRDEDERIQRGDLCLVWSIAPFMDAKRGLLVACFIVDTRRRRDDSLYEMSGPDLLGELQEFYAVAPVGSLAEVVVTAMSLGEWPGDEVLEAAYPERAYFVRETAPAGTYTLKFPDWTTVQETDSVRYEWEFGEVFTSTVTQLNAQRDIITIADALPHAIYPAPPANPSGQKVVFRSTRLRVSDGSALIEGGVVFYTPGTAGGNSGSRPQGNFLIDRIEEGEGGDPDYVFSADPLADQIDDGSSLTQMQYIEPTTGDVEMLLFQSTSTTATTAQWSVIRGENADIGTAYAPDKENVWDVLAAIAEMSGYQFRRYFRGLSFNLPNTMPQGLFNSWRVIEYFPAGEPIVTGEVTTISEAATISASHATILRPVETEDAGQAVTTIFPFGGGAGSGAFDFRLGNIGAVLAEYGSNKFDYGVIKNQYFIYNRTLVNAGARLVDATETFAHISPLHPESFDSRKQAADQLIRAACEWLLLHEQPEVTYVVDVFTIGEPRVGDLVSLSYAGDSPYTTTDTGLIITEVRHRVDPDPGYRVTTLTLNKAGFPIHAGARSLVREVATLKRGLKQANIGARGDARIAYDRLEFGKDATVDSQTGNLLFRSLLGDVTIRSEVGNVYLDGNTIDVSGSVDVTGVIRSDAGFALPDGVSGDEWIVTIRTIRGIPRVMLEPRESA